MEAKFKVKPKLKQIKGRQEMTKQEKIREMVKSYLVGCIHGGSVSYAGLSGYDKSTVDFQTDELLEEQSKLGVVIQVEKELPQLPLTTLMGISASINFEYGYKEAQQDMTEAGFVVVELLIEEFDLHK